MTITPRALRILSLAAVFVWPMLFFLHIWTGSTLESFHHPIITGQEVTIRIIHRGDYTILAALLAAMFITIEVLGAYLHAPENRNSLSRTT